MTFPDEAGVHRTVPAEHVRSLVRQVDAEGLRRQGRAPGQRHPSIRGAEDSHSPSQAGTLQRLLAMERFQVSRSRVSILHLVFDLCIYIYIYSKIERRATGVSGEARAMDHAAYYMAKWEGYFKNQRARGNLRKFQIALHDERVSLWREKNKQAIYAENGMMMKMGGFL